MQYRNKTTGVIWVAKKAGKSLVIGFGKDTSSMRFRCYPDDGNPLEENPRVKLRDQDTNWEVLDEEILLPDDWRERLLGASPKSRKPKSSKAAPAQRPPADERVPISQGGLW
jgi:hypothetical protein